MAKSENTEVNGETLSVDTLSNLFSKEQATFVVEAGPNNTKDELGRLYRIAVPRSFVKDGVTVDMAGASREYASWLSNNWNGSRHGFKDLSLEQKLARAADPASNGFMPSEPAVQSPVQIALQNIIARQNADKVRGMSDAQLSRDSDMQRAIETILNDPSRTEKYRGMIEQELASLAAWSQDRTRKGESQEEGGTKFEF